MSLKQQCHYQYAEVLVNGKTGSRQIPLINSIPYVKDYLDHEHPMSANSNSIFICGTGKSLGKSLRHQASTLYILKDIGKNIFLSC